MLLVLFGLRQFALKGAITACVLGVAIIGAAWLSSPYLRERVLPDWHDWSQINQDTMETNVKGVYMAGTAIAGTQDQFRLFIENCHIHTERIVASLLGEKPVEKPEVEYLRPES